MGIIALVGGDEFRPDCAPMDRALLGLVVYQPSRVLILPTAAARQGPQQAARNGVRYFASLGARAEPALLLTREDADTPRFAALLDETDLVYLTGGDPGYLIQCLQGSAFADALRAFAGRGGSVAGSSAGAMALAAWLRGGTPALGFVPRVVVFPHHRPAAALGADALRGIPARDAVALGIPTATACATDDGAHWRVLGAAPVSLSHAGGSAIYQPGERFALPG